MSEPQRNWTHPQSLRMDRALALTHYFHVASGMLNWVHVASSLDAKVNNVLKHWE